jgi:mono/diheme cytochrome c family protein
MHAPVSTFEHQGRQYVLAFSAGSALLGSARGDSVWLFGLDGTLPPVQPGTVVPRQTAGPAPQTGAAPAAAAATSAVRVANANVVAGQRVYEQACVFCHGTDGKGDHGGASLAGITDLAAAAQTVTAGRNSMPPFGAALTSEQIRDVSAYVVEALAGRPAR